MSSSLQATLVSAIRPVSSSSSLCRQQRPQPSHSASHSARESSLSGRSQKLYLSSPISPIPHPPRRPLGRREASLAARLEARTDRPPPNDRPDSRRPAYPRRVNNRREMRRQQPLPARAFR